MKQKMRALHKKLDLTTYAHDKQVEFEFKPSAGVALEDVTPVSVPVPIMYRLYHLGRAYDLNQLKLLQPTGTTAVSFVPLQLLGQELEQVAELVDDPVIRHYGALLGEIIRKTRHDTEGTLLVKAP